MRCLLNKVIPTNPETNKGSVAGSGTDMSKLACGSAASAISNQQSAISNQGVTDCSGMRSIPKQMIETVWEGSRYARICNIVQSK